MEVRIESPKEFAADWQPVAIGSWQSRVGGTGRGVPSAGTYRMLLNLSEADLGRNWSISAGIVGNDCELLLNGRVVRSWLSRTWYDPVPQRTLHSAPVPFGLLVPGSNWLTVREAPTGSREPP